VHLSVTLVHAYSLSLVKSTQTGLENYFATSSSSCTNVADIEPSICTHWRLTYWLLGSVV